MSSKLCLLFIPVFCIPQRVIMSIMCFLAIAIAYAMRVCLSVAITEMVAKVNHTESSSKGHYICPADPSESGNSSSAVKLLLKFHYSLFPNNSPYSLQSHGGEYNWSQDQQGYILSSFYIGYVLTHVPGEVLMSCLYTHRIKEYLSLK